MVKELPKNYNEYYRDGSLKVNLVGFTRDTITRVSGEELQRLLSLGDRVRGVMESGGFRDVATVRWGELRWVEGESPFLRFDTEVAYRDQTYGGGNIIEVSEIVDEEERKILMTLEGFTTGTREVRVVCADSDLKKGIRDLITKGRMSRRPLGDGQPTYPQFLEAI